MRKTSSNKYAYAWRCQGHAPEARKAGIGKMFRVAVKDMRWKHNSKTSSQLLCAHAWAKGIKWIQTSRANANSEEEEAEHAGELQAHIRQEEQAAKTA